MLFGRTAGEIGLCVFILLLVYWGAVVPRMINALARALGDKSEPSPPKKDGSEE